MIRLSDGDMIVDTYSDLLSLPRKFEQSVGVLHSFDSTTASGSVIKPNSNISLAGTRCQLQPNCPVIVKVEG